GQVSDADHARSVAQLGGEDLGVGPPPAADQPATVALTNRLQHQLALVRDAAADDEGAGVEQGGQIGQAGAGPASQLPEGVHGDRVALPRGLADVLALDAVRSAVAQAEQHAGALRRRHGPLVRVADEGLARGVLLPAALAAAAAEQAVRHHAAVAELGGDAVAPAVELAADDGSAAETGADGDADDVLVAGADAEPVLAPGGGVRVVLDDHG